MTGSTLSTHSTVAGSPSTARARPGPSGVCDPGRPYPRNAPRLLFVESYPQAMYGQQRTLLALLSHLPDGRVHPLIAVPGEGPFVDAARRDRWEVVRLPYPSLLRAYGGAVYRYRGVTRLRLCAELAGYLRQARRFLKEQKIGGVFCNDLRGLLTVGLAARTVGIPVMIWDKLDRPHGWLDLLELPLARVTAVISEAVKTKFPGWQRWLFRGRIRVVPEGADLELFDAARSIRAELGIGEDRIVVAMVGSITPRKGQDRLLHLIPRLVAEVPNILVLVVGEPPTSEEDRRYAESLPNRQHESVRFLGMREDVPAIMKSIDILVVPSRHEGMGLVLLEAMACRKPVVGARTGGIPDVLVHAETGLLFHGDSPDELWGAIVRLCRSRALRTSFGQAGRRRVEDRFLRTTQMEKIVSLLLQLVESVGKSCRP